MSSQNTFIVGSRQRFESYCREHQISPARHIYSVEGLYGHRGGRLIILEDADWGLAEKLISYARTHDIETNL